MMKNKLLKIDWEEYREYLVEESKCGEHKDEMDKESVEFIEKNKIKWKDLY